MNFARAEDLRRTVSLQLRLATVNFFGTDDLFDLLDDEREDCEDGRPPNCAMTVNGSRRATAADATPIRLSITNLLSGKELSSVLELSSAKAAQASESG